MYCEGDIFWELRVKCEYSPKYNQNYQRYEITTLLEDIFVESRPAGVGVEDGQISVETPAVKCLIRLFDVKNTGRSIEGLDAVFLGVIVQFDRSVLAARDHLSIGEE